MNEVVNTNSAREFGHFVGASWVVRYALFVAYSPTLSVHSSSMAVEIDWAVSHCFAQYMIECGRGNRQSAEWIIKSLYFTSYCNGYIFSAGVPDMLFIGY